MKIVNKFIKNSVYCEVGQSNPIRYSIGFWDKETKEFTAILPKFKCRDYLNDVAYLWANKDSVFQNTDHLQYGFPVGALPYDTFRDNGGMYLCLTGLVEDFQKNVSEVLERFLDKYAPEHKLTWEFFNNQAVVFIPEYYMIKSYRISLLTFLMRMCNHAGNPLDNPEIMSAADREYWKTYTKFFNEVVFEVPEKYASYAVIVATNPEKYNLESMGEYSAFSTIHDAGFIGCMSKVFPKYHSVAEGSWSL